MHDFSAARAFTLRVQRAFPVRPLFSGIWTRQFRRVLLLNLTVCAIAALFVVEARSSWLQSRVFGSIAARIRYPVDAGPSRHISFPAAGPLDARFGYSEIPQFVSRAREEGYSVAAQARDSAGFRALARLGVYPIYHEKSQAGLRILDRDGLPIATRQFPERVYRGYENIPPMVVNSLLFMENRSLIDPAHPRRNPAIEWTRFSHAMADYSLYKLERRHGPIGASTLATQLEKVRHSPGGRTHSAGEKLKQMLSASFRAYQDGPETQGARQRIVCDYINSLPLGAGPATGEVIGLGDGLWSWYGAEFDEVNRVLTTPAEHLAAGDRQKQAVFFREALSLLIATRSPFRYLNLDRSALSEETDRTLRILGAEGIISTNLRDLALQQKLSFRAPQPVPGVDFVANKAANLVRADLSSLLGVNSTYELDRLDLSVLTSIDQPAQVRATSLLRDLTDRDSHMVAGLRQPRLLASGDPQAVVYSFTLFERGSGLNLLRIQTDTMNQPLNINQGTKLELGSTAKLRTVILYLQIVERLHSDYSVAPSSAPRSPSDPLTTWAISYLSATTDRSLRAMLEAALDRRYSASPAEAFFTAGGLHQFHNFDSSDNGRILTVREAFENSVNLVFIRIMRDIERYYLARLPGGADVTALSTDQRHEYLTRFADQEGKLYLSRFYRKHEGESASQAMEALGKANPTAPGRLAAIYRFVWPEASATDFAGFVHRHVLRGLVTEAYVAQLYQKYAPGTFNLQDRAYLAGVHPLELWLLRYKAQHPQATLAECFNASGQERQQAYTWLFETRHSAAQDLRIRILQEQDAFQPIRREWNRLGYPFSEIVPSYATAIGVSGDMPAALAELMGIIVNHGFRLPSSAIRELRFAENTPVATILAKQPFTGERVLSEDIADLIRSELIAVVEHGTARRAAGGVALGEGKTLALGGKTGTGDNRVKLFGGRGYLVGSRVVSRTAVFAFIVGDRYFGTVMAFVPGSSAGEYQFTSALAVQVFKELEPILRPLLGRGLIS